MEKFSLNEEKTIFSPKTLSARLHEATRSSGQKNVETIAVYWEPKVKTYGFQVSTGLSLVELFVAPEQLIEWGENIQALETAAVHFVLVLIQHANGGGFHIYLLTEGREHKTIIEGSRSSFSEVPRGFIRIISPVELIHFQGPHFGDRYGILSTAFNVLNEGAISILAAACTGASIYLVLPEKKAEPAKSLLEGIFEIPKRSIDRRRPSEEQDRSGS